MKKFKRFLMTAVIAAVCLAAVLSCDNGVQGGGSSGGGTGTGGGGGGGGGFGPPGHPTTYVPFVPVTGIEGVPRNAILGTDLPLTGTVAPFNATGKTIIWTVEFGNDNSTGVTIDPATGVLQTRELDPGAGPDYANGVDIVVTATIERGAVDPQTNGYADYTEEFTITITQPGYSVQLDIPNLTYSRPVGYEAFLAETITITNIGTAATGAYSIAIEGDTDSFTATGMDDNASSLAVSGTKIFTIKPNHGLGLNTYTARVVISNENLSSQAAASRTFTITITVEEVRKTIELKNGTAALGASYTFAQKAYNEAIDNALTFTITNTGNVPTGALTVAFTTSQQYDSFIIDSAEPGASKNFTTLAVDSNQNVTLEPAPALVPGTYNAALTVSADGAPSVSFTVKFTVVKANRTGVEIAVMNVADNQIQYQVAGASPAPANYDVYLKTGINAAPAAGSYAGWTKIGDNAGTSGVTYNRPHRKLLCVFKIDKTAN
jgi:hypothetical protein